MRLLKASAHRRMAWKNGGGETIEIAVHPGDSGLDAFDWRVSMANVSAGGPFSVFPGIDRTLCLLSGKGMTLSIEGHGEHALTTGSTPLAFPADAPTVAHLADGPILDLNVMTRRGLWRHRVNRIGRGDRLALSARWSMLVALTTCRIEVAGETCDLAERDALLCEETASVALLGSEASAFLVEIEELS